MGPFNTNRRRRQEVQWMAHWVCQDVAGPSPAVADRFEVSKGAAQISALQLTGSTPLGQKYHLVNKRIKSLIAKFDIY